MITELARREVKEIRAGRLSDKSIAKLRKGGNAHERLIRGLGHGGYNQADLVLHPRYGVVVRKTPGEAVQNWGPRGPEVGFRHASSAAIFRTSDQEATKVLQKAQQSSGKSGGFARVRGTAMQRRISFSDFVPGKDRIQGKRETLGRMESEARGLLQKREGLRRSRGDRISRVLQAKVRTPWGKQRQERINKKVKEVMGKKIAAISDRVDHLTQTANRLHYDELPLSGEQKQMVKQMSKVTGGNIKAVDVTRRNVIGKTIVDFQAQGIPPQRTPRDLKVRSGDYGLLKDRKEKMLRKKAKGAGYGMQAGGPKAVKKLPKATKGIRKALLRAI